MPSGGARARSGPAPDPNAARRDRKDDVDGWTTLSATGREGEPPTWPFETQSMREVDLWASFWRKPQAIIWERDQITEFVALFVRQFAEGERSLSSAENRKTIRTMLADLYLTPDSLARARFRVGTVEAPVEGRTFRKAGTVSHLAVVIPPPVADE